MKLYELTKGYQRLLEMAEDPCISEEEMQNYLDAVKDQIAEKMEGCCKVLKTIEAQANALKEEERRLRERRQVFENRATRLKNYMGDELKRAGIKKVEGSLFTTYMQKNPPSLRVVDEKAISDPWWRTVRTLDKQKMMDAIKSGCTIGGVEITQGESLRIR